MCNSRFFLAGNHARNGVGKCDHCRHPQTPVTLGNCFQVFYTISDQQWDKEQEKSTKKRRRNLRNLSEESLEGSPEGEEENISVKNKTLHHYCGDSPH